MDIGRSGFRNPFWVGFVTHFGDLSMEIIIIDLQLCVFPGPFYFIGLFNFTAFWIPNSRKPSYCLAVRFAVAPCSTLINLRGRDFGWPITHIVAINKTDILRSQTQL